MKGVLYEIDFSNGFYMKTYTRVIYTLSAMVSQICGLFEPIFGIKGVLILTSSYSKFVFYTEARLFFSKVKENKLFKEDHD